MATDSKSISDAVAYYKRVQDHLLSRRTDATGLLTQSQSHYNDALFKIESVKEELDIAEDAARRARLDLDTACRKVHAISKMIEDNQKELACLDKAEQLIASRPPGDSIHIDIDNLDATSDDTNPITHNHDHNDMSVPSTAKDVPSNGENKRARNDSHHPTLESDLEEDLPTKRRRRQTLKASANEADPGRKPRTKTKTEKLPSTTTDVPPQTETAHQTEDVTEDTLPDAEDQEPEGYLPFLGCVVQKRDGQWVEVQCPVCHANARIDGVMFRGFRAVKRHIVHSHPQEHALRHMKRDQFIDAAKVRLLSDDDIAQLKQRHEVPTAPLGVEIRAALPPPPADVDSLGAQGAHTIPPCATS